MIGLSLSFCIRDIVSGRVQESDVERIIARTAMKSDADFECVIATYSGANPDRPFVNYWEGHEEEGRAIARRLWEAGKIDQPRLRGEEPSMGNVRWMNGEGTLLVWDGNAMVPNT